MIVRRRSGDLRAVAAFLLCLCGLLVGLDALRSLQERAAALDATRQRISELARSLGEQISGVVLAADLATAALADRIEADGDGAAALAHLRQLAEDDDARLGGNGTFHVFDERGGWLAGVRAAGAQAINVAGEPFFAYPRDHPGTGLLIGLPIRGGPDGRLVIPLTRRFERPDGRFGGVIVAALDVAGLQALYGSFGLGRHGVVTLFRSDGALLLRNPPLDSRLGDASPNAVYFKTLAASAGIVEGRSDYDGVMRVLAYRRIAAFPLVLFVGLDRTAALEGWRRDATVHLLGVLTLAGLVWRLGVLLVRGGRREHAAQLAAAAADSEYRLLADHATDMILRVREDGVRVYASPACLPMLGYTQAEMLRRRSQDDIHPDDFARLAPQWSATFAAAGATTTSSYRMRRRDGSQVWVEANSQPLPRAAGEPAENLVVVRDITQRQAVASRLQEANRLLTRAEAMTHLGHWRYELQSRVLFWSDEVYRICGLPLDRVPTLEEAIGTYHPDDRAIVAGLVQRAIDTGEPFEFDLRVVRPDGTLRHVAAQGEVECDAEGLVAALVGTFQDVTESRELELRLRHDQQFKAIGQLAAGVAHDFNNILQGVLGGLELIIGETAPGSAVRECAEVAFSSASRGASLTHQLLSFARKQVLMPRAVALDGFLEEMQVMLARTLGPQIVVETAVAAALPQILVDPDHLRSALLNLAVNAGQAMPKGGRLRIEAALRPATEHDPAQVAIAVSDSGSGMAAATLARATDPFFTTRGPGGSGLGLPMVQGFARQSGGDLRLSSVPGQGTRAEILLPPHSAGAPSAGSQGVPGAPSPRGRVLLVDDVPDVLFAAAQFLERAGLQVVTAESGDAALALLGAGARFDALVTDYAMPGLSGVDLVELARDIQPGLPALIITGFAEVDTARIAQVSAVMRKPFRRRQLVEAVLQLMQPAPDDGPPAGVGEFASPAAAP